MCEILKNPYYKPLPSWLYQNSAFDNGDILEFHRSLEGYEPTKVYSLDCLAKEIGVKSVYVKDESTRFGVKAFKPLGASYTIYRFLKERWELEFDTEFNVADFKDSRKMSKLGVFTFCAATDGNHGRAVAWTARMLGQSAVIYMPSATVKSRIDNIKAEGAEVILVDGTFDECVRKADTDSKINGWVTISDTAYQGYMYYPQYIMAGYSTIFHELEEQIHDKPDIVILQAGVGGLAAAGTWYFTNRYHDERPEIICLEPTKADSFMESIKNGNPTESKHNYDSIMAGLNCGVSLLAWDYIKEGVNYFLSVIDRYAELAMRQYFYPYGDDVKIISGESGASGMAGLLALLQDDKLIKYKKHIGINENTSVLLINSEGDTDPDNFRKVVL